ncbi:MAG: YqgE/AlgH family protein [Solirubrobacterales bacterium]|nr:YqgE/AlgH family protein [Solirubrobacterales bacterium]
MTDVEFHRGRLLVASPSLVDPNFLRTVILVTEHSHEGAMGVVLNRPSPAQVGDAVPELSPLVGDDSPVYVGGPVQKEALIVLADFRDREVAATIVVADVGFVSADADTEVLVEATRQARVFAGYAGWGPGQLEAEVEEDAWIVEAPVPGELFADDAAGLWSAVLERKGGRFALLARMPLDPSLN